LFERELRVDDVLVHLNDKVQAGDNTRSNEETKPKHNVPQRISPLHELRLAERCQRQLRQLESEQIPPDLLEQTEHENLMYNSAEQESEERRLHLR